MKTRTVIPPAGIDEAVGLLRRGEIVALPTETVYGLGADALNPVACAKIFEAKNRPLSDPLIVHLPSEDWLEKLAVAPPLAVRLAGAFWPGPLTLVVPRREIVPDIVTAGQETVALRRSAHPVFREIAARFGGPIAAPSANRFGRISPTRPEHVLAELEGSIPLVVDGGPCEHGLESTIVLVRNERLEILRNGPVTANQLAAYGPLAQPGGGLIAPGTMKSHYAPHTPLRLLTEGQTFLPVGRAGLLAWRGLGGEIEKQYARVEYLSRSADLREAAANLYGAMRRLDEAGLDVIVAEPVPMDGLGVAIMERLRKAAARE